MLIVAHPGTVCKRLALLPARCEKRKNIRALRNKITAEPEICPFDENTEMCYDAAMKKDLRLKLTIRLYSGDDERCFGPGIAVLLHRVEEHRSLRAAAASMEMAYSKAWRIVRTAEAVFDCKLLSSVTGGKNGGGAVLTKEAEALLAAYDGYCAEVEKFAAEKYRSYFD